MTFHFKLYQAIDMDCLSRTLVYYNESAISSWHLPNYIKPPWKSSHRWIP